MDWMLFNFMEILLIEIFGNFELHVLVLPICPQPGRIPALGPVEDDIESATDVHGAVVRNIPPDLRYPFKCYGRDVAMTHDDLSQVVNTMVYRSFVSMWQFIYQTLLLAYQCDQRAAGSRRLFRS